MTTRRRIGSPRTLAALLLAVASLVSCSIATRPPDAPLRAQRSLADYAAAVGNSLKKLREFESSPLHESLPVSDGLRRSTQQAGQAFQATLLGYVKAMAPLDEDPESCRAQRLEAVLQKGAELRASLQEKALEIALLANTAQKEHQAAAVEPATSRAQADAIREYMSHYQALSSQAMGLQEFMVKSHLAAITPYTSVDHPSKGVFHFLTLRELNHMGIRQHEGFYQVSWKEWLRDALDKKRVDCALSVFALVATAAEEFAPDSLGQVSVVMRRALAVRPPLQAVERMEQSIQTIEAAFEKSSSKDTGWKRQMTEAVAALLVLRAHALPDPEVGISHALEAMRLAPDLSKHAHAFLIVAARRIGDGIVATGDYTAAVEAYRKALALGPVPDADKHVAAYRSKVVDDALADFYSDVVRARFTEAKTILAAASRLAAKTDEKRKVREALYKYYSEYSVRLFNTDVDKAVTVTQEMVQSFPNDERAKKKLDDGLLYLLKRDIGDLKSAYRTKGATKVFEMLREAVSRMSTDDGVRSCQKLLRRIEKKWTARLEATLDPREAYIIAVEVARLRRKSEAAAKGAGAAVLWKRFEKALAEKDWGRVEGCLETCFEECPEVERPTNFKEGYVRFLEHLDGQDDAEKLGKHIVIFSAAYPGDTWRVKRLVVKRLDEEHPLRDEYAKLLLAIDPEAAEVSEHQPPENEVPDFVDESVLSGAARWWREPGQEETEAPFRLPGPETTSAAPRIRDPDGRPSMRESPVAPIGCALGCAGSLVFLIGLPWLTRKKGWLPFRWYVVGTVWVGMTVGFVWGKLEQGAFDVEPRVRSEARLPAEPVGVAVAPKNCAHTTTRGSS